MDQTTVNDQHDAIAIFDESTVKHGLWPYEIMKKINK